VTGRILRSGWQTWRKSLFLVISIFALVSSTVCCGYLEGHGTFYPNDEWKAEISLSLTPQQLTLCGGGQALEAELQEETAAMLEGKNIRYTWEKESQRDGGAKYIIAMEGEGLDEFSQVVFSRICPAELLGSPASLYLTGKVSEGQALVFSLDNNPSTGYLWETAEMDGEILRQTGDVEFRQESGLLGAPGKQIVHFEGIGTGETNLELIYHRPWEKDTEPTREMRIQAGGIDLPDLLAHLDSLTPDRTPSSPPECECQGDIATPAAGEHPIASPNLGLPEAFNWCDNGGCTPVKNQGGCGSCWAFATVAPLESNIKIKNGVEENLAEQYLVSCNTDGWGCDGGWWAHDYHWWKIPPSESEAGAVLEEEFPYQANDVPCCGSCPFNHPYELDSWSWVGEGSGVPSVEDLKQAIYTYGPISAAICAGSAFGSYGGGIFETDETCTFGVNHAVALVGWDDSQGTNGVWILRNSWGTGWGESGYMRIGYGVSNVGYSANYIVYDPGPAPNMPSAPSPGNHTTGVSVDTDLNWSGGDPDAGDTVNYTVYFGTNSTPPFRETIGPHPANQTSISYSPGTLSCNSTYYWQIAAQDNHGASTTGPVWDFTTQQAPAVTYNLTISSASGGIVTTPGEGTFTCNDSEVVNLVAAADTNYTFANWTGDVGAIADVNSTTTNITMNGNYSIMANFEAILLVPEISFSPSSFNFNAVEGSSNPASRTLQIWNSGGGTLNWSLDDGAGWLGENPTSGNSTEESDSVTVSVNVTGMSAGDYPASINITAAGANNTPRTVPASLHIFPPGTAATLEGHVNFTGRGSNNTKWAEPFNVTLFEPGNLSNVLWIGNATTNNTGVFNISGLTPGTYDIGIKNWTCLSEVVTNVTLTAGMTTVVDFGTVRQGDANDDDYVGSSDFSLQNFAYNTWPGQPKWNPYCDFNRDDYIGSSDYSVLSFCYYNQWGDAYGYF